MATTYWRNPANTPVKRVYTITPANVEVDDVFTLTITYDDGTTEVISFTATATTVANVTAGLVAAWNASTNPLVRRYVAADVTTHLTLTAATAGINPVVTSGTTDGGGNNTQTLVTTESTVGVDNNDYDQDRNWSEDAEPTTDDDVVISGGENSQSVDILRGLDQSTPAIDTFQVTRSYNGKIGRFEGGVPYFLKLKPNTLDYFGRGQLSMFDVGAEAINPYIECHGQPGSTPHAVYIKGSAIGTLEIAKGNVGVGVTPGDATTAVTTLLVSWLESQLSDSIVTVGSGVTLGTLTQSGGQCLIECAATTVTVTKNAIFSTYGTGAITTCTVHGVAFLSGTGTITNLHVYGKVDFTRDRSARTITNITLYPGAEVITHSGITFTNRPVVPTTPGAFTWTLVG